MAKVSELFKRPMNESESQQILRMLERSRVQMLLHWGFFASLAMHLNLEEDYSISTAATDGKKFYYNPHFIKKISEHKDIKDKERNWVMAHEVLHAALKHPWRRGLRDPERWNYACDYAIHCVMVQFIDAVESKEAKEKFSMPQNCLYDPAYNDMSAEEIYNKLPDDFKDKSKWGPKSEERSKGNGNGNGNQSGDSDDGMLDDHSKWDDPKTQENKESKCSEWEGRVIVAAESSRGKFAGNVPGFLKRLLKELTEPQKDWRVLLQEFCQPEINDYSFNPPDRRYSESDFFLPDFNDTIEVVRDLLFFADTSGSVSDKQLTACFSEINGAIHQFSGKLFGKLGFFDHVAYGLTDFEDVDGDVSKIRPKGGGGTNFAAPFDYINEHLSGDDITGIIILTDGECSYPPEEVTKGIPVLWVYVQKDQQPPWGMYTTINVDED